ncbi:hypothetical protein EZV62_027461 [Acer yangbiense]|uniref:Fatty acid hydroxylase domain-containing protein n=1 Tax=Acer yangbiense TaxID=1000413 RepID=A0A5C7GUP1_9ROSI|nr:hypothetical protein EZV62_027461 [Acer yangbiense]
MVATPFTVDLNKPLVFQVGHLGKAYDDWVHKPIVSKEGPRFFANDFLEAILHTNTLHYLLHGCHHKHPMDGLRLVFPPAATAILCVPLWNLFKLLIPPSITPALFGGTLLGYVMYDCTHYYLHHGKPSKGYSRDLKRYHLNHHFRSQSEGFGITSSLWDRVFGTLPSTKAA